MNKHIFHHLRLSSEISENQESMELLTKHFKHFFDLLGVEGELYPAGQQRILIHER